MIHLRRCSTSEIPPDYLDIAWQRFFEERQRTVSVRAHFPWLLRDGGDWAILASLDGVPAGMLIVRRGTLRIGDRPVSLAGIGLVCTSSGLQGSGVGSAMVRNAAQLSTDEGLDCALLWTAQHGFYERLGFSLADRSMMASFRSPPATPREGVQALHRIDFKASALAESRLFGGPRGEPAFAARLDAYRTQEAEIVIGALPGGEVAVLDWAGPRADVVSAITELDDQHVLVNDWGDCALSQSLEELGWRSESLPNPRSMWKPLSPTCPSPECMASVRIPVLDRF